MTDIKKFRKAVVKRTKPYSKGTVYDVAVRQDYVNFHPVKQRRPKVCRKLADLQAEVGADAAAYAIAASYVVA